MTYEDESIVFYENGKGKAGVSLDGGLTIIIPTGRKLVLDGLPAWEEAEPEKVVHCLTTPQKEALQEYLAKPPLTEIEQMAETLRRATLLRDRRERYRSTTPVYSGSLDLGDSALVVMSEED